MPVLSRRGSLRRAHTVASPFTCPLNNNEKLPRMDSSAGTSAEASARATPAQAALTQNVEMPDIVVDLLDASIFQTGKDNYNQVWAVSKATVD